MRNALVVTVIALLIVGCARATVSSFTDPKYVGHGKFKSVMVIGNEMSLDERKAAEAAMFESLAGRKLKVEKGLQWIFPTRSYTLKEASDQVLKSKVETVLMITTKSKGTIQTHVPQMYWPGTSHSTVNVVGNQAYINTYSTPGYTTGGYGITKPKGTYIALLIDAKTGAVIWRGDVSARGSAWATYATLAEAAGRNAVDQLTEDGLF